MNQQDSGKSRKGMRRSDANRGQPGQGHDPIPMSDRTQEVTGLPQQQQQPQDKGRQAGQQAADTNVNTAHGNPAYQDERDDEGYLREDREERIEEEAEEA